MTKAELVQEIAKKTGFDKQDVSIIFEAFMKTVKEKLAVGESITLREFGTYSVKKTAERTARNPKSGEKIIVKAGYVPKFTAAKRLKKIVKESKHLK